MLRPTRYVAIAVAGSLLVGAGCSDDDSASEDTGSTTTASAATTAPGDDTTTTMLAERMDTTAYLGEYALVSDDHDSMVTVTLTDTERVMTGNGLPNHDTGEFPNAGNPNTISEQAVSATFPLEPVWTGDAVDVKEPGISIAGVKFDPLTAETATCADGTTYRIEAIQDVVDLGLDDENAHVQPSGAYHYHGVSTGLVDAVDTGGDLVHVGFAHDGYLIVYSRSGAYAPGYRLDTDDRSGTDCTYLDRRTGESIVFDGPTPDGSFVEDWVYVEGAGDLDECNGTTIDGEYVYLITDEYPYVGRCLMGEFDADRTGPAGPPPGG